MLSPEQNYIVENIDAHNLVIALPGSGKTHTLKYAIDYLLDIDEKYNALVVTFTNASTIEMTKRVYSHISDKRKHSRIKVSTFHKVMLKMSQQLDRKKLAIGGKQTSYVFRAMTHSQVNINLEGALSEIEFYGRMYEPCEQKGREDGWKIYNAYVTILHNNKEKDFNIITRQVLNALESGTLKPEPYTHIMVDEFQDTDAMQLKWLFLHGNAGAKITVVGDDDQSIYSFRGGKGYENMVKLQEEFDSEGLVLSVCRRCPPEVLNAAGKLIVFNKERMVKDMNSSKTKGSGSVSHHVFHTAESELENMMMHIRDDHQNWAVLARNNLLLDLIESELLADNIPYDRISGKSFFDIWQVTMLLNLLKAICHKHAYNELKHALGYLGEDENTILEISAIARQMGGINKLSSVYQPDWQHVTRDYVRICERHYEDTNDEQEMESRFKELYDFIKDNKKPIRQKDDETRSKDTIYMDSITSMLRNFNGSYIKRLSSMVKKLDKSKNEETDEEKPPILTLSTMHSAKGLEFPNVWLMSFNEGVIPSKEGVMDVDVAEEERRLAFVGITRCEIDLHISSWGGVSSFLTESFPEEYQQLLKG